MPYSTYADSCKTADNKYVLAQFRSDANLDWVAELRAFLTKDELKYKDFAPNRSWIQSYPDLWDKIRDGISQAEIFIVDPVIYQRSTYIHFLDQRAEPGIDFGQQQLNELAGIRIIQDSPLAHIATLDLPFSADKMFSSSTNSMFLPSMLQKRAGGKLNDAVVLAARSHAIFSSAGLNERLQNLSLWRIDDSATHDLTNMIRQFDVEHPGSIPILNEAIERFCSAVGAPKYISRFAVRTPLVRETNSREVDHINAADIAAGWAAEQLLLNGGEYRVTLQTFARVNVNGKWLIPR